MEGDKYKIFEVPNGFLIYNLKTCNLRGEDPIWSNIWSELTPWKHILDAEIALRRLASDDNETNHQEITPQDFDPYKVRIKGVLVDPCAIGEAYRMSPTLFQSVKKLLRIGKKHKSVAEDIFQSVTSIFRWVDIHKEDNPELEDFFDKVKKEIEEREGN